MFNVYVQKWTCCGVASGAREHGAIMSASVACTSAELGSLPGQDNVKYYVIYCIFYILHLGNAVKTPIFENAMLLSMKLQPDSSHPPYPVPCTSPMSTCTKPTTRPSQACTTSKPSNSRSLLQL